MAADVIAEQVGRLAFQVDERGLDKFQAGMKAAGKDSDFFGSKAVALGTALGNLASKAASMAVDVVKDVARAGLAIVTEFGEAGTEIDRLAKRVDLGVVAFQRLNAAARKGGLDSDQLVDGIKTLNAGLAEMALTGGGPAKDALGLLGVGLKDLEGLDTEAQINLLADALAAVPDATDRAFLAVKLFGEEAGVKLAPVLAQGSDGLKAMGDAAEQAGLILDERAVAAAKRTKAALGDFDRTTQALKNTIAASLAPTVADIAERLGQWYRENEQLIAQRVPEAIDAIVSAGGELITWGRELAEGIDNLTSLFGRMGDDGESAMGGLVEVGQTAIEWSKAGIETFVEWTDDVAEMAELVWDVAEAIEDGLTAAYEAAEPVIDTVTTAISEQLAFLEPAIDFLEQMVERVLHLRDVVSDVVADVGLGRAFDPATIAAEAAAAQAPADSARYQAEQRRALLERDARKRLDDAADTRADAAARARRRSGERYGAKLRAGSSSGGGIDTTEAERLLGEEIAALALASGATSKAQREALRAAASALKEGSSTGVARQAAAGVLSSRTGVDISAQAGPDAALFGMLTQIGGAEAARAATDGARFVNIDQSQNNTITVNVPESFGQALSPVGAAEVFTDAMRRILIEDYREIIDRTAGSMSP